jgi:hypothetical protein
MRYAPPSSFNPMAENFDFLIAGAAETLRCSLPLANRFLLFYDRRHAFDAVTQGKTILANRNA